MTDMPLPVPPITAEAAPYWEGARQGRLMLQRCTACDRPRFYPRPHCPHCWSEEAAWFAASGRGHVHSFTVIHRPPDPAFQSLVPYVVALVVLEEGPRMMTNIVGPDARGVAIDEAVEVVFEEREGGVCLPQFRRLSGGGAA